MAKVKIQGHASGTGILTVTAPNTSTDRTITLPDATGTLLNSDGSAASLTAIPAANITGTLPAISGANLTSLPIQNRPNAKPLIINGNMQVAQRGASFTTTSATGNETEWPADRFHFDTGAIGAYTTINETLTSGAAFEAGFKNAARIDCTTAVASPDSGDYFLLATTIEAQDCLAFKKGTSAAETMTVAFWVKSNKTGTSQLTVKDGDNDRICAGTYAISSANTWEHKVINIAADTSGAFNNDNGAGYIFEWWLDSGATYSSGTAPTAWEARTDADRGANHLSIANNTANDWAITGVQVEVGTYTSATLPPFQHESYGDNLARCQRYYQLGKELYWGHCHSGTGNREWHSFQVEMRAAPTAVTTTTSSSLLASGYTENTYTMGYNSYIRGTGNNVHAKYYADITFSAEL